MIHICYGLHDHDGHYSKFCGTSIVSIFENTSEPVTVHILHDNSLTADNGDKFRSLEKEYGQHINFYNVEEMSIVSMNHITRIKNAAPFSSFHLSAMYRLLLPEIIEPSIDKMIYLDAGDTIVNLDINTLWAYDVRDYPIAALAESEFSMRVLDIVPICKNGVVQRENYFNSGVIIMNLEYLRKNIDIIWGTSQPGLERPSAYEFLIEHQKYFIYLDQDMLNYCFADHYLRLPTEFNCIIKYERLLNPDAKVDKKIYHFAGLKPELNIHDPFNRLYFEYFTKTPWFNVNIFEGIFDSISQLFDKQKSITLNLVNLLAERRRAFFLESYYINSIRKLFDIKEDEFVCNADDPQSIEQLVELMQQNADDILLFVLVDNYIAFRRNMRALKFVEGRDFINITNILTSEHGMQLRTQSIVNAM